LLRGQEGRRSAAEVDEIHRPVRQRRLRAQQFPFAREQVQILFHLLGVLVRVHPEVAEVTPLAAERNVEV
jgi:hypothetical protein